jgi:hypothetical protein
MGIDLEAGVFVRREETMFVVVGLNDDGGRGELRMNLRSLWAESAGGRSKGRVVPEQRSPEKVWGGFAGGDRRWGLL